MPQRNDGARAEFALRAKNVLAAPHLPQSMHRRRGRRSSILVIGATALLAAGPLLLWTGGDVYRPLAGPGHGRGMSQHGALHSAQDGWTAEQILGHYYPGATLGAVGPTTLAVRLMAQDDSTLDAYSDAGARVAGRIIGPGEAAHLTALPDGGANVVVTSGCDGEVLWQTSTADPWVYPVDPAPGRPATEHLTLCGGTAYRGSLGVATEDGAARTINRVDVEDYLLGVLPAEVQANWADKGAVEALRAQAVAARSYALAETRYPYAQTCDTTDCQVYPGTIKEDPRTADAVASTAGMVLLRDGHILRSEYSAAPDGGQPADIQTFEVGPTPAELSVGSPPPGPAPRTRTSDTESPIDIEYARLGGAASSVGEPIGPEMVLPENAGIYRLYSNGVIIYTPTLGAQVVDFTTLLELVPDLTTSAPGSAESGMSDTPAGRTIPDGVVPGPGESAESPGAPGTPAAPGESGGAVPGTPAAPGDPEGSASGAPAIEGPEGSAPAPGGPAGSESGTPGGPAASEPGTPGDPAAPAPGTPAAPGDPAPPPATDTPDAQGAPAAATLEIQPPGAAVWSELPTEADVFGDPRVRGGS
ncbi:SpoIID/LytB domain-containing protein [Nocardia cyriacigeorgica]|uniref:SpoIID/LytB domain-containing protein n=1 Tax=Nocardia cyriacigeorgica TaxID=135487 RepID=UPI0024542132|nr:SpoIID/LytB domain-containing protein [Nocardia cyriacigeorgica]